MPMIEIEEVHKRFGRLEVLRGITFDVQAAETVVVAGPSGSGKSTLLRCINGLEKIQSGDVRINGTSVHDPSTHLLNLRRQVGIVFQQFNLFPHLTVLGNITLPLTKVYGRRIEDAETIAMNLLENVSIADKANVYPSKLSGGQQQRAAIARALAMNPKVMLFDEPTSALDPELIGGILDLMSEVARKGMTMLVVTHEMGFARRVADRVIFMADGLVVESGSPESVIDHSAHERTRRFMKDIAIEKV